MITRFTIRNFKRLQDVTLELGSAAVFIGPNNSGKTTALQALALWDIGWRRWAEKRDQSAASERAGVTINRRDLYAIPVPSAKLLWADLHTHDGIRKDGKTRTEKVFISLTAEGDHAGQPWRCTLDFYYANEESFYCRLREGDGGKVPAGARQHAEVLLLLSFLLANPGSVLLLDEPDAHLEILRQRDVYNLITEVAAANGSQIVAASHSEVVLQEAAERDVVMAFVGRPHRIDTRSRMSQVKKALESIRMADYYLAEQKGWVLYLEGSTDLAILRRLAQRLEHAAAPFLADSVPVVYLGSNKPQEARDHFHGLREAKPDLVGLALFDRLDRELQSTLALTERAWSRREIENCLVTPDSLHGFVVADLCSDDLLDQAEAARRLEALDGVMHELQAALHTARRPDPWGPDIKVTDEFLDPLFENCFERLDTPQRFFKRDFHGLADVLPLAQLNAEVVARLDDIATVVAAARPVG